MTIRDCFNQLNNFTYLNKSDINQLLEFIFNLDISEIIVDFNQKLNHQQLTKFEDVILQLKENKPVAYIINQKSFYGFDFYVDNNVLIPRVETELIIDLVLDYLKNNNILKPTIFDIGTGSGAIGITLAKIINESELYLSDLDNQALKVAKINAQNFNLENIKFLQGDFIQPFIDQKLRADIIVSNPPYIDHNDSNLQSSVLNFEPHLALFANNFGLEFYEKLFLSYQKLIKNLKSFLIVLEFGWNQKEMISDLANDLLDTKKVKFDFVKDNYNNWRCIIITSK